MFACSGPLQSNNANIAKCDFLASQGQNGGGVTLKGKGRLLAIYSACVEDEDEGKKLGYCARITNKVVELVEGMD
jgi:hypothetical protein